MVTSTCPPPPPSLPLTGTNQDDAINVSWHFDYVPYMLQQECRREDPNFESEMAEIAKTYKEGDRHHYSATLETLQEVFRRDFPDEPDYEAEAKADYDAYMADHPGEKEEIARKEEEDLRANTYTPEELKKLMVEHNARIDAQPKVPQILVEIEEDDGEEEEASVEDGSLTV